MIEAAIFDMDGLLVDSEPLWTIAEIEVFASVGIELDAARCAETVGMGLEEVVRFRHRQQPWSNRSLAEVGAAIHDRVVQLVRQRAEAMPGARAALGFVRDQGARVGLATSSDDGLIEAVLDRLGIRDAFDHVQSAQVLARGKPHPEVYLVCARRLSVEPARCVGLEDSVPGLIAVKAAGMRAVAVPEPRLRTHPGYGIADVVLDSLTDLNDEIWNRLSS